MSAVYSKQLLSGSTNGKNIVVNGTGTAAPTLIHTAVAGTSSFDEVYLYAHNISGATTSISICWGGTNYPDDFLSTALTAGLGRQLLVDGKLLQNGLSISAYVTVTGTNSILVDGFVNRISNG